MTTERNRESQRRNPVERALAGWQPARVLMSANRLNFFNILGDQSLTADQVASQCATHPRSTRMLLNACVALGIMEKEGNAYRNSQDAMELLVRGKPKFIGDGIAHQDDLWQVWGKLPEAVRTNSRVGERYNQDELPRINRNFIMAMHDNARRLAPVLSEALNLKGKRQLFDCGGGPGTYSIFLVKRYRGLHAIVFDLPQTIEITQEIIAEYGAGDLVTTCPGNYFKDNFGQGNDVVLISAILHSMGPERSKGLLKKAYDSLVSGGIVVVHENLISEDGTSPVSAVLFSLNMLVNTGEGQSYSGKEIMDIEKSVGFIETKVAPLPEPFRTSLVIGTRK